VTQASNHEFPSERHVWRAAGRIGSLSVMRAVVAFCLYEVCFYLAYRFGMSFSHATASPFWFPDSILLCALLLAPRRWWWAFVLGTLPIRLALAATPELPLWFLLSTFAIDAAKGVVTALALRRFLSDPLHLRTVRDFALYCLIAVMLIPATAAFAGAGVRLLLGPWLLGLMAAMVPRQCARTPRRYSRDPLWGSRSRAGAEGVESETLARRLAARDRACSYGLRRIPNACRRGRFR